ncbi:hypothetical protein EVAR_93893_1 [Eumeta japonica]|uniref:Secreted protein n=1 Tax=Eumeta variegata TaxID=151549 RepID=A0A4C1TX30_EUMVA|nr:hypothetical protein EVAR_93893_1 [Eumeta japonica]
MSFLLLLLTFFHVTHLPIRSPGHRSSLHRAIRLSIHLAIHPFIFPVVHPSIHASGHWANAFKLSVLDVLSAPVSSGRQRPSTPRAVSRREGLETEASGPEIRRRWKGASK